MRVVETHRQQLQKATLELLRAAPQGLSEYQLLRQLRGEEYALLPQLDGNDHLGLFQSHFLLFHSLYHLRDRLHAERAALLNISPLHIELADYQPEAAALCEADPLREYYLDLDNLAATGEAEVQSLLAGFWRRMHMGEPQQLQAALSELELTQVDDFAQVRRQYQRLVMRHHPDRGGEAAKMQALNDALAIMRLHFGH